MGALQRATSNLASGASELEVTKQRESSAFVGCASSFFVEGSCPLSILASLPRLLNICLQELCHACLATLRCAKRGLLQLTGMIQQRAMSNLAIGAPELEVTK